MAGSYHFVLVCVVALVAAGQVAMHYRGVWPLSDSGEDTFGCSVPDTLPTVASPPPL